MVRRGARERVDKNHLQFWHFLKRQIVPCQRVVGGSTVGAMRHSELALLDHVYIARLDSRAFIVATFFSSIRGAYILYYFS